MRCLTPALLALALAQPAAANDGIGGLTATGLRFGQTDAVQMAEEDLFISQSEIRVSYLFRNITDQDVTGEVIFPLPPIQVAYPMYSDMNLPANPTRENLVNFSAVVDGQPVAVSTDVIAVVETPYDEGNPGLHYDTPGRDVTAELAAYGIPLTLDFVALTRVLLALSQDQRAALTAAGLASFYDDQGSANGTPTVAEPAWALVWRYHWTQTFPAGAEVRIAHEYENYPPGSVFGWEPEVAPDDSYRADVTQTYCIDEGTSQAMSKALKTLDQGETNYYGTAWYLDYVLRTANSWAGPIGKFRLTLDKGDPKNVVTLCMDGIKKVGPTTFVVEKTDYTPERDLRILLIAGNN
jgi:hypothetical protein